MAEKKWSETTRIINPTDNTELCILDGTPLMNKRIKTSDFLKNSLESVFKNGTYTIDTGNFFPPATIQFPFLMTPGSYGVTFTEPPIPLLEPTQKNFTLTVDYASYKSSGSLASSDITHILTNPENGKSYIRKVYHTANGLACSAFTQISGGGVTATNGTNGKDGTDTEFIYKMMNSNAPISAPGTSQTDNFLPEGWSYNLSSVNSNLRYGFMSKRKKVNNSWSVFSTPVIVSNFAENGINGINGATGHDGNDGKDGTGIEFIFTRTKVYSHPDTPTSSMTKSPDSTATSYQQQDWFPVGWTDDMSGVDSVFIYEWVSKRTKNEAGVWSDFSPSALWAKYSASGSGDQGIPGESGKDGKDYEFIFTRTKTLDHLETPPSVNTDGYVPPGWTNDMSGVDALNKYEWVSKRYKDTSWSVFSPPVVWAVYSENGVNASNVLLSKNIVNVSCLASGEARTGAIPTDIYVHAYDGASLTTISSYLISISSGIADATYSPQSKGVGKITLNSLSSDYAEIKIVINVYIASLGTSVAIEKIIPIIKIKDGYAGPYIIARGAYNPGATYYGSPARADVVSVTIMGTTQWYITKSNSGSFSGIQPQVTGGWETKWDVMPSFEMIATGMLFAENANIAEFIFNGGKLKSQYPLGSQQQNLNNGKNLELDGVNGTIKLSTVNGDLEINKEGIFLNDENGLNKVSIFNGDIPEITDDYEYGLTPPVVVTTGALSQRSGTFVGTLQFDVPNSTFVCDKNVNKTEIRIVGFGAFSGSNSPVSSVIQVYNSVTNAFVRQIESWPGLGGIITSTYNLPIGTYKLKVLLLHPNSETINYTFYLQSGTITYQNIVLGTMIGNNGISYSAAADGFFSVKRGAGGAMNLTARGDIYLKGNVHIVGNTDLDGYVKINGQAQ